MDDALRQLYRRVFLTKDGQNVLKHIRARVNNQSHIDRHPADGRPNAAYMNPNAALWKQAQSDLLNRIESIISNTRDENDDQN